MRPLFEMNSLDKIEFQISNRWVDIRTNLDDVFLLSKDHHDLIEWKSKIESISLSKLEMFWVWLMKINWQMILDQKITVNVDLLRLNVISI